MTSVPLGEVHMHVARDGYVGIVRLEGDLVDIAAAVDPGSIATGGGPGGVIRSVLEFCGVDAPWAAGIRWHGTPPLRRSRACVASGGVFVVGDAAGYVEPFSGEGMTWAITGAVAAGDCAVAHLNGCADAAARWAGEFRAIVRSRQTACGLLAWVVRHPVLVERGLWLAGAAPWAAGVLTGRMLAGLPAGGVGRAFARAGTEAGP